MNEGAGTLRGGNNSQLVMQSLQELDEALARDGMSAAFCTMAVNALIEGIQCKKHYHVAAVLKILLRGDAKGKLANVHRVRLGVVVHKLTRTGGEISLPNVKDRVPVLGSLRVLMAAAELREQWVNLLMKTSKGPSFSDKELARHKAHWERAAVKLQRLLALFRAAARQVGIALYWQKETKRLGRKRAADA